MWNYFSAGKQIVLLQARTVQVTCILIGFYRTVNVQHFLNVWKLQRMKIYFYYDKHRGYEKTTKLTVYLRIWIALV